jgi:hypothetical protein
MIGNCPATSQLSKLLKEEDEKMKDKDLPL